jgi:hypothetical protein
VSSISEKQQATSPAISGVRGKITVPQDRRLTLALPH